MGMLRLLDVLNAHCTLLLEHHPQLLPTHAPLLLKAASWNPHLLGRHTLRALPLMVVRDTLPQLLAYVLDMPAMAAAQDTTMSKEAQVGSVYMWPRWQHAPQGTAVRRSMGARIDAGTLNIYTCVGSRKHTCHQLCHASVSTSCVGVGDVFLLFFFAWRGPRAPTPAATNAGGVPVPGGAHARRGEHPRTGRAVQPHGPRLPGGSHPRL